MIVKFNKYIFIFMNLQFRGVIIDLFRENFKVKKTHIMEQCKEILGEDPPSKAEFDRILKVSMRPGGVSQRS